jgi:hypothetical protein
MFILPQAYSRPNKDLWTRLSYNLIAYIHSFSIFHCFCISCVVRIARRGLGGIWTSHLLFVFAFEVSWLAPGRVWWMCGWDGVERGYNVLFSSLVQWTLFLPEGFIRLENTASGASGVSNVSNFSMVATVWWTLSWGLNWCELKGCDFGLILTVDSGRVLVLITMLYLNFPGLNRSAALGVFSDARLNYSRKF